MKQYLEHMKTKSTHERRAHAMRVAGVVTAVVFVGWLATLGVRLSTSTPQTAQNSSDQTQLANVINGTYTPSGNTLEVATSSQSY